MFPVQLAGLGDESEIARVGTINQQNTINKATNFFIFSSLLIFFGYFACSLLEMVFKTLYKGVILGSISMRNGL